jgi:hypothetical protein
VPAPSLATITDDFLRDDPGPKDDTDADEPASEPGVVETVPDPE